MGGKEGLPEILAAWRHFGVIARERLVPGVKNRRLEAERKAAKDHKLAEQARKDLDSAYGLLGGVMGTNVSLEQIETVLLAEKQVVQYSSGDSTFERYERMYLQGEKGIDVKTAKGLSQAYTIMDHKTDYWRGLQNEGNPDSEIAKETQRRVNACKSAASLLFDEYMRL